MSVLKRWILTTILCLTAVQDGLSEGSKILRKVGETFIFNCSGIDCLNVNPSLKNRLRRINYTTCIVELKDLQISDSNIYSCNYNSPSFELLVGFQPTEVNITTGYSVSANPGDELLFKCQTEAHPPPHYIWKRKVIRHSLPMWITVGNKDTFHKPADRNDDDAKFICIVKNRFGTKVSAELTVHVANKTNSTLNSSNPEKESTTQEKKHWIIIGASSSLLVVAASIVIAFILWKRRSKRFHQLRNTTVNEDNETFSESDAKSELSQLTEIQIVQVPTSSASPKRQHSLLSNVDSCGYMRTHLPPITELRESGDFGEYIDYNPATKSEMEENGEAVKAWLKLHGYTQNEHEYENVGLGHENDQSYFLYKH